MRCGRPAAEASDPRVESRRPFSQYRIRACPFARARRHAIPMPSPLAMARKRPRARHARRTVDRTRLNPARATLGNCTIVMVPAPLATSRRLMEETQNLGIRPWKRFRMPRGHCDPGPMARRPRRARGQPSRQAGSIRNIGALLLPSPQMVSIPSDPYWFQPFGRGFRFPAEGPDLTSPTKAIARSGVPTRQHAV